MRVAIEEGSDIDDHQAFLAIGDEDVAVVGVDGLFFVGWGLDADGIVEERAGHGDGGGVFGADISTLTAEWGDWGAEDAFAEAFLVDVGDIENLEASGAVGGVEVFAAEGEVVDVGGVMFIAGGENFLAFEMILIIAWVSGFVERASDGGLRLFVFSPDDSVERVFASDPGVASEEVDRARAETEELGDPRLVIVGFGEVTIRAIFCGAFPAGGVGEVRVKGLAAVAIAADGLLLGVDPFPIGVLGADDHRAGGADDREAMFFDRGIDPEHKDIVANDLGVIGDEITIDIAFVFIEGDAGIGLHGEMTSEAAGCPGGVTDLAIHGGVAVGELIAASGVGGGSVAPAEAVALQSLCVVCFGVIDRRIGVDDIDGLGDFPAEIWGHRGILVEVIADPFEAGFPSGDGLEEVDGGDGASIFWGGIATGSRGGHGGLTVDDFSGAFGDRAMAIDAGDGDGIADFAVEVAVAVDIDIEVAIGALHSFGEVDIFEVNGAFEIAMGDDLVIEVEAITLAILFKNGTEHPPVAVIIGHLGVFEFGVEFGGFFEEVAISPEAASGGGFGVLDGGTDEFAIGGIVLFFGVEEFSVGFLIPPSITEVRVYEGIALVHVAVHALAGRDGAGELMENGVAAFVFGNGGIGGEAEALVAIL